jgi:LPXTG-site transpeptidase (sortase) family protein
MIVLEMDWLEHRSVTTRRGRTLCALAAACCLLAPARGPLAEPLVGACVERDSVLLSLTDNARDSAACGRRIALFESVFGPRQAYGVTMLAGEPVPEPWLDAVIERGAVPVITLEPQPGADWGAAVTTVARALAGREAQVWVSPSPLREGGASVQAVARMREAAELLRARAPGVKVMRTLDTRAVGGAQALWGEDQASLYDACGLEIGIGHRACQGPRDLAGEVERALAARDETKPLAIARLAVARECSRCKQRFPEQAANELAYTIDEVRGLPDLSLLLVDSSDSTAAGGAYDFGLLASDIVADACREALPPRPNEAGIGGDRAGPAAPSDPTARWTLAVLVCGVLLVAGALWAADRLRPAARPSPGGGGGWGWAGVALIAAGVSLLAYPWLTGLLTKAFPGAESGTSTHGWFRPPGSAAARGGACRPPFRVEVPSIGLSEPVGEGASVENLRDGPMHYTGTALPGETSNCCIAGHRSTYGAPFRRLLDLRPGDEVILSAMGGGFRRSYRVAWVRAVDAADGRYLAPTETEALTLSTCHPFGLASERLMLRAYPGAVGSAAAHTRPLDERFPPGPRRLLTRHGLTPGGACSAWVDLRDPPSTESAPAGIVWGEERREGAVVPKASAHWTPPRLLGPGTP